MIEQGQRWAFWDWGKNDWVYYPDEETKNQYSPNAALVPVKALPPCQLCSKEVKPGEDLCWDCLGEGMPLEAEQSWYIFAEQNYGSQIIHNTYPIVTSPSNVLTFNAASSILITAVGMPTQSVTFTFTPPITMVNGDTLQIKLDDTIG